MRAVARCAPTPESVVVRAEECRSIRPFDSPSAARRSLRVTASELIVARKSARNEFGCFAQDDRVFVFGEGCGDASGAQSCWGSVCGNSSGEMQVRSGEKFVMVPAGEMQVHSTRVWIDCCAQKARATNSDALLRMTEFLFSLRVVGMRAVARCAPTPESVVVRAEECRSIRPFDSPSAARRSLRVTASELIVARKSARNEFGCFAQDDRVFVFGEGCGDASGAQSCWGSVCGNSSGEMQVRSGEKFVMVPAGEMQVHSTRVWIDCCAQKARATNSDASLRMTEFLFLVRVVGMRAVARCAPTPESVVVRAEKCRSIRPFDSPSAARRSLRVTASGLIVARKKRAQQMRKLRSG